MGPIALNGTRGGRGASIAWALLLLPTLAFSLIPLAVLLAGVAAPGERGGGAIPEIAWRTIFMTFALCLGTAITASVLGLIVGGLIGAAHYRGRNVLRVLVLLPLLVPPYLHAIGWTNLLRAQGAVSRGFASFISVSDTALTDAIYSLPGAIFILTLAYFPIAALLTEKALSLTSPTLVDAARTYGASTWQVWRHARWPFARPSVVTSAMIVFLLVGAELGVPTVLRVRVFSFEVLTQLSAFNDVRSAVVLSAPLVLVGVCVIFSELRLGGAEQQEAAGLDVLHAAEQTLRSRWPQAAAVTAVSLGSVLLPLGALAAAALEGRAFVQMITLAYRPALRSIQYCTAAGILAVGIAVLCSFVLMRGGATRQRLTDLLLIVGFSVPGAVLALGMLETYGRPSLARVVPASLLVIGALFARYQILVQRGVLQTVLQIPGELWESAAVEGAGLVQVLRHVFAPLTAFPVAIVAVIFMVLAFNELGSTILLYPPGGETLPIALYSIEANSPRSYVAALALINLGVLLAPCAVVSVYAAIHHRRQA